ncbi:MFS transporter [Bradyrhizobium sp. NP1]|uniref:MFS transporter n=1 Tax=Bradyrhizobium sp. NP1 TaxID=3049772 RepID=UPI0025A5B927|nr:MFS transporter [Bradyrhizobium sp. NP1]WJR77268.1 MFS transporter [Bradyrhizobium sp. NP1]
MGWLRELDDRERKTMIATGGGWALDAFDVQVYSFVVPTLISLWGISRTDAGLLGTAALLISALGGWLTGVLADRFGRVRMLQITIVWFAVFTFLSGFTSNFTELLICRGLQGLGFGGEWAAGSVLIGEVIRAQYRGRAVGVVQASWHIGWGASAILFTLLFSLLPADIAWRAMFWVGLLPALFVLYIRKSVREPDVFDRARARDGGEATFAGIFSIFAPAYLVRTILCVLVAAGVQGGYYALSIWLPTYLKTTRDLSVLNTGGYLLVIIVGAWCGCVAAAHLADAIGRRRTFFVFAIAASVLAFAYTHLPLGDTAILLLGFPLGFCANGIFAPMGPFLTELFPTRIRGTAQGFCFNAGRAIGALFPTLVGYLSATLDLGQAIGVFTVGAYAILIVAALFLPETNGTDLAAEQERAMPPHEQLGAPGRSGQAAT